MFHRLDYTGPQILEKIVHLGPDTFALSEEIISEWSLLENALLDVGEHSIATHPDSALFPPITWPRSPHEYGYRRTHRSAVIAHRSATRSQEAFHSLSAVVTFILSLWTKSDGLISLPFRSAFWGLANRFNAPINRSWIDRFYHTQVCNITFGVRTGCFVDPYTSSWGRWLVNFVRAGVQVWVVWGKGVIENKPSFSTVRSRHYEQFLPPLHVVLSAHSQFRENQASPLLPPFLPVLTPSFNLSTSSAPSVASLPPPSSSEPPSPPHNSRQHRGETLAAFLSRLESRKKERETLETSTQAQSRRDQEKNALEKGYSKTCTVFQWEETQGHYLRVKVDRAEVPGLWNDYPASRRVYHSGLNEWDLCPPIPPFSESLTQQDLVELEQYEEELAAFEFAPATLKAPSDQFSTQHSGQVDELASAAPSSQAISIEFDIVEHLKDRYGFDAHHRSIRTPLLHSQPAVDVVEGVKIVDAKRLFLFDSYPLHATLEPAIKTFCSVLSNEEVQVRNLTRAWDLSGLQLKIDGLRLSLGADVDGVQTYIISSTTAKEGHWVIFLQKDPTPVLQIYRNRWTTLDKIVHELVYRGIPFNTGVPGNIRPKVVEKHVSKGLGLRPAGYSPRSDDYNAYVSARTDIFRSHLGRAALLKGGLIARLARDTVEVSDVISGPEPSTSEIVGTMGGVLLVDDRLSDYLLDVISGVYYVETAADAKIQQHLSWWPKDGVWYSSGFYSQQWSADAEAWYQSRLKSLKDGSAVLYNSTDWKSKLRRYKKATSSFLSRNSGLSESVIDNHMSYAPFCYLLHSMS
jgi:hypothetical protein